MAGSKGDAIRRKLHEIVEASQPGDRLAPERELMVRFDVARETLRRAVDEFVSDGLLERRAGVGTFVTRPKLTQQFRIQSFTQDMQARRMTSSSRLISSSRGMAGARIGNLLNISPGDEVITVQRLRLADGEPMALELLNLPAALVPGLDTSLLASRSLYSTLASDFGIVIASGSQTIEATVTDQEESGLLGIPRASPALLVDRVTWTADEKRIESVRSIYRGDRYKFEVNLSGVGGIA